MDNVHAQWSTEGICFILGRGLKFFCMLSSVMIAINGAFFQYFDTVASVSGIPSIS